MVQTIIRTGSPAKRKQRIDYLGRGPCKEGSWLDQLPAETSRIRAENREERTPPPCDRTQSGLPVCPLLAPPKSPWKKARRQSDVSGSAFDEDYFDEEAMWTSGEHFKFEQQHSRCQSPNGMSAEAGRLSFGTLDLSSNSEAGFEGRPDSRGGSDVSVESLPERLDASTLSPKACNNSTNNLSSASFMSQASTKYSPSRSRVHLECPPSPSLPQGNKLNTSAESPHWDDGTSNRSSRAMSSVITSSQLRINSPLKSDSPLQPQRLFNASMSTPTYASAAHRDGSDDSAVSSASTQCMSFALPPRRSMEAGQYHRRRNPFLGVDAISHSPYDLTRMVYPSTYARKSRLTVRSFHHDFFDFHEVGSGLHGKVYKCYRKIDLCPYAVKEIQLDLMADHVRERVLREIYAHAAQSDNIHMVRYYNAWEQEEMLYIQTELCGGTLASLRAKQGPFSEAMIKDILVQVACGLAYMHAHNLAHADIRPENIYWTERGIYKVGGFGLVTLADMAEYIRESDKKYLSKEVLEHDFSNLAKADMFSLGASLFELASTEPLPDSGPVYDSLRSGCFTTLPDSISFETQHLLHSLMQPDASQRPSAADIVRHDSLFPLVRQESFACLRATPPRHGVSNSAGESSPSDQGAMLKIHLRALDAEKKVAKLQALLVEAQAQAQMYKDYVEDAGKGGSGQVGGKKRDSAMLTEGLAE